MNESKASRTLLKSPPELWSEVSSATSLQRHMDRFGEIRITKLEPETAVAWEGEHARGTITLEASGWGTRVSLTAEAVDAGGADEAQLEDAHQADDVDPVKDLVEPAGTRVEPELEQANAGVEHEHEEILDPHREAETRDPALSREVGRDQLGASTHKPRWTERLARAFKRWFAAPPRADTDPGIQPPAPAPEPSSAVVSTPEPEPVVPEPAPRVTPPSLILAPQPKPQPEPLPQIDDAPAAALDAALDSLGQAHHRPFSRA
jgi:hypothetical protein